MKTHPSEAAIRTFAVARAEVFLPVIVFAIPFLVSGPQWLTGTLVNLLLFLGAALLSPRWRWPVIVFPGLGAVAHGVLFGPATPFLLFFLPVIWAGNWLLVQSFVSIRSSLSAPLAVIVSAGLKAALLLLSALAYFRFGLVPELFLTSMSVIQFITALAGGLLALLVLRFIATTHE
ncbi:MAG: hypothetical protein PHI23_04155 [Candidatus Peribacteraceae bacterium]|nr:hypothetical protein [Candidatus Peribacteraceae bacterium]